MKLYLTTVVLIAMASQAEASQKGLRKGRKAIATDVGVRSAEKEGPTKKEEVPEEKGLPPILAVGEADNRIEMKDAGEKETPGKPNKPDAVKQAEKEDNKDQDKMKKNKDTQKKKKSEEGQKGATKEEKGKREDKNDDKKEKDVKTEKDKREKTVGEKENVDKEKKNDKGNDQDTKNVDKEKKNVDKGKKNDKGNDQDTKNVDNEEDTEDAVTEYNVAPASGLFPIWMRPCKYLEQQFNGNVECNFSIIRSFIARREILFSVKASEPICDPLNMVCATPTFSGGVNFKDVMVESGFGFSDVTVMNRSFGNIDFELDVCMSEQGDDPDTPTSTSAPSSAPTSNTTSNATETEMDTSKMQTEEAFANDEASFTEDSFISQLSAPRVCGCTASVLGQKCNSCKVCGNGGGFSFDCSVRNSR